MIDQPPQQQQQQQQQPKTSSNHITVAFFVSYIGSPFRGSQLQAHSHPLDTPEGVLLAALSKINLINCDIIRRYEQSSLSSTTSSNAQRKYQKSNNCIGNRILPAHIHLGRASRTDKGVSAMCNIFNVNVKEHAWTTEVHGSGATAAQKLNEAARELLRERAVVVVAAAAAASQPPVFVVQTCQQVPRAFTGRFCANRRMYRYLIPAFALDPAANAAAELPGSWTFVRSGGGSGSDSGSGSGSGDKEQSFVRKAKTTATAGDAADSTAAAARQHFASRAARANELLAKFAGKHNRYHNFTGRESSTQKSAAQQEESVMRNRTVLASDDEAMRKIWRAEVLPEPLFLPVPDRCASQQQQPQQEHQEYTAHYVFQIDGGSFLLHMIRKIVGTLIAVARGARETLIDDALSPEKLVNTPMAPSRYLVLTRVFFDIYEHNQAELFEKLQLPPLSDSCKAISAAVEDFQQRAIFAEMAALDATGVSLYATEKERAAAAAAAVAASSTPTVANEMRRFVRMVTMHNWAISENPEVNRPKVGARKKQQQEKEKQQKGGDGPRIRQRTDDEERVYDDDENDDGASVGADDDDDDGDEVMPAAAAVSEDSTTKPQQQMTKPRIEKDWTSNWLTADDIRKWNSSLA